MPEQIPQPMNYLVPVIHTLLSVNNELYRLGLVQWVTVIERWLNRYDGLEQFMDTADDFPINQVVGCLQSFSETPTAPAIADALAHLSFLSYRVRAEPRAAYDPDLSHDSLGPDTFDVDLVHPVWDARKLSLQAFLAQGVTVWQSEAAEKTEPPATAAWLLHQYYLQQMIA